MEEIPQVAGREPAGRSATTSTAGWMQVVLGSLWAALGGLLVVLGGLMLVAVLGAQEQMVQGMEEAGPLALLFLPLMIFGPMIGAFAGVAAVMLGMFGAVVLVLGVTTVVLGRGVLRRRRGARRASIVLFAVFTLLGVGMAAGGSGDPMLDAPPAVDPPPAGHAPPEFGPPPQFGASPEFGPPPEFGSPPEFPMEEGWPAPTVSPPDAAVESSPAPGLLLVLANGAVLVLLLLPETRRDFERVSGEAARA